MTKILVTRFLNWRGQVEVDSSTYSWGHQNSRFANASKNVWILFWGRVKTPMLAASELMRLDSKIVMRFWRGHAQMLDLMSHTGTSIHFEKSSLAPTELK